MLVRLCFAVSLSVCAVCNVVICRTHVICLNFVGAGCVLVCARASSVSCACMRVLVTLHLRSHVGHFRQEQKIAGRVGEIDGKTHRRAYWSVLFLAVVSSCLLNRALLGNKEKKDEKVHKNARAHFLFFFFFFFILFLLHIRHFVIVNRC